MGRRFRKDPPALLFWFWARGGATRRSRPAEPSRCRPPPRPGRVGAGPGRGGPGEAGARPDPLVRVAVLLVAVAVLLVRGAGLLVRGAVLRVRAAVLLVRVARSPRTRRVRTPHPGLRHARHSSWRRRFRAPGSVATDPARQLREPLGRGRRCQPTRRGARPSRGIARAR